MGTAQSASDVRQRRFLLGLSLAAWMEFFTFDAINLILPDIAGSLAASQDQASWILTTYSSALFIGISLSVWLSVRFGHRRFIVISIVTFSVASIGCGLSNDLPTLLIFRVVQGLSGAGLTVAWRAMVYLLVSGASRGAVVMRISIILYFGTAAGLFCGGWIVDNLDWRLVMVANAPIGVVALLLTLRNFPDAEGVAAKPDERLDLWSALLLVAGIASLQVLLSRGEIDGWLQSPRLAALALMSALAFVAFIARQCSAANSAPIFDRQLFRERNVIASIVLGTMAGIILSGSLYAVPEYLRNVGSIPHSATRTGQIMCIYALMAGMVRPISGFVIARIGQRKALVIALGFLIASMLGFATVITRGTPDASYVLPLLLYAGCLTPLLSAVGGGTVSRMPREKVLRSITIYTTFRQLGAALGVALVTNVLNIRETHHSARLFDHLRTGGAVLQGWLAQAAQIAIARGGRTGFEAHRSALALLKEVAQREASTLAYADAFLVMAAVGAMMLCLAPIMSPTPVVKK